MLELDDTLPAGALVSGSAADLAQGLQGIWLPGRAANFITEGNIVTGWQNGPHRAVPAEPNTGNARLIGYGAHHGLRASEGVNCGLVLPRVTDDASSFSMAVVYLPPSSGAARTLLTLNPGTAGGGRDAGYLFLSETDGITAMHHTDGLLTAELPAVAENQGGPRLLTVTIAGKSVALAEGLSPPVVSHGRDPGMRDKPADLFIGCRSHRKGLSKTLGGGTILDVFFWPNRRLLLPETPADQAQLLALRRWFLWEY